MRAVDVGVRHHDDFFVAQILLAEMRAGAAAERLHEIGKLHEVLSGTGSAVFVGTLTTVWGFTAMMLADYRAMYWLGLVMTIGKLATLAASLLALPALLVVMKKVR